MSIDAAMAAVLVLLDRNDGFAQWWQDIAMDTRLEILKDMQEAIEKEETDD